MSITAVAKLAGVSKATVSRVLNHQDNVHPDTARAVRRAIEQSNYVIRGRRHPAKEASAQPKLSAFALVVPEVSGGLYGSLQKGLVTEANTLHHQVLLCHSDNNVFKQGDEILQLVHKGVAGVAMVTVTSAPTPPHHIELLQRANIPVVLLHRAIEGVRAPVILLPLEQVGYDAGRALIDRGHRRVALVISGKSKAPHEIGLVRALREVGSDLPEQFICRFDDFVRLPVSRVEDAVLRLLGQFWSLPAHERPTAIFATFDSIAEVVYMCLMRMGLRVPGDMSLVGFGGAYREGAIDSRLTSVVVDEARVGTLAAQFLSSMIQRVKPIDSDEQIVMPLSLSNGETIGWAEPPAAHLPSQSVADVSSSPHPTSAH